MDDDRVWLLTTPHALPQQLVERAREMLLVPLRGEEAAAVMGGLTPPANWEGLTKAELKVVELAAQGLTNPDIGKQLHVSPRTVSTHLQHSFRKLGVSTRTELAALVARGNLAKEIRHLTYGKSVPHEEPHDDIR